MATRQRFDKGNRLATRSEESTLTLEENTVLSSANKIHHLLIEKIKSNPYQPRLSMDQDGLNELKKSIGVVTLFHTQN